jgi:predicted dithiol-disulfide oxidoreductase (DUF899 family)
MFGPDYTAGCPSCSAIADGFNGFAVHLANHDVTLSAVSRAPLAKLQAYKRRMGWSFPWASSFGSDFNADFNVSITEEQQREGGSEYNYRRAAARPVAEIPSRATPEGAAKGAAMTGTDAATYARERPGMSAFVLEDCKRERSNLPIQRSAMSWIGTGLMKCSFSRPFRFQDTRLASSRTAKCFATA